ncbi:hypothetical protein ACRAWG_31640 [Methylobacterium sp. P31]
MSNPDAPPEHDPTAPAYRLLFVGASNEVVGVERLTASSDDVALAVAEQLAATHPVELWDGIRFIEWFEPNA